MRKFQRKYSRTRTKTHPKDFIDELSLADMFEKFIAQKQTEGLTARTLKDYEDHFRYFLDFVGGDLAKSKVNIDVYRRFIDWMLNERGLEPATINVRLRTTRAFLRFCFIEGLIDEPIHERIKLVKSDGKEIEALSATEVRDLLRQIDVESYVGFRDYVMICTLLDTMVRISELLAIKRHNVDIKGGQIRLEAKDTKTRRERIVPLSSRTAKMIHEYMLETEDFGEKILFLTYDGRKIKTNTWRKKLKEYGYLAGITEKRVSPHTFRHTGALFYIMNGGDPFSLQKILGHTDMSMVRKYVQMSNSDIKKLHNNYSPLKNIKL